MIQNVWIQSQRTQVLAVYVRCDASVTQLWHGCLVPLMTPIRMQADTFFIF